MNFFDETKTIKNMKKLILLLTFFILNLNLTACAARAPIPVGHIPPPQEVTDADRAFGKQVLNQLSQSHPISKDPDLNIRVTEIVDKLAVAANAETFPWRVYVLESDQTVNAGATRGNYMFVWTGMLKKALSDDELATVLGHEMAHVLARHTHSTPGEEAQNMITGIAGVASRSVMIANGVAGPLAQIGAQVITNLMKGLVSNPEQQRQEHEADQIGMFIMAKASYDPRAAVTFWERLSNDPQFSGFSIAFLSTHPASADRVQQLRETLPKALEDYRKAKNPNYNSELPSMRDGESFDFRK